jgi:probable F420-dependent oxidoreductase
MKVDGSVPTDLPRVASTARAHEAIGYSGVWSVETAHDAFLPLLLAAEHTSTVELGTGIAVALARNPMLVATLGWDLQSFSAGRFVLGLGSQVKPHITKRFSMPWSHPAPRMREFVLAVRAIWANWLHGERLAFRGEFYRHSLMTPVFTPSKEVIERVGLPRVFMAGVGQAMTEVAGEVGDGFICHPFTTERYLRQVTLPALERGRAKAGLTIAGFEISGPSFVVTGADAAATARADAATREQLAFYGSTPAYRGVLELHGWGDLGDQLNQLSRAGRWQEMAALIDDDVLDTFAVRAEPEALARALRARYGDVVSRITCPVPYQDDPERWRAVLAALQAPG